MGVGRHISHQNDRLGPSRWVPVVVVTVDVLSPHPHNRLSPWERVQVAVIGVGGPISHQWNRLSPWERVLEVIPAIDLGWHCICSGSRCSYFSASRWDSHRHNRLGPRKGVHVVVMEIDDLRSHRKDRLGTR